MPNKKSPCNYCKNRLLNCKLALLAASAAATAVAPEAAAAAATATLVDSPPGGAPNDGFPAPPAPLFTLLPALENAGAFLDLSSLAGAKLFKYGAQPLSQIFDFTDHSDLQIFLYLLKTKSKVHGWRRVFIVPINIEGVVTNHSLLKDYSVIPLASVTMNVLCVTYAKNMHTKVAQDSFMVSNASSPPSRWSSSRLSQQKLLSTRLLT
jgi:hypothetical protein